MRKWKKLLSAVLVLLMLTALAPLPASALVDFSDEDLTNIFKGIDPAEYTLGTLTSYELDIDALIREEDAFWSYTTDFRLEKGKLPGGMEFRLEKVGGSYENTLMLRGQPAAAGVYELWLQVDGVSHGSSKTCFRKLVLTVRKDMVAYDLKIDGVPVTDGIQGNIVGSGAFSYDPGTNTLHVKKDYTQTTSSGSLIESGIDGLIIQADSDVTLKTARDYCLALKADTILTGPGAMSVRGNAAGVYVSDGATLTVRDIDLTASGTGTQYTSGLKGSETASNERLVIEDAFITAHGGSGAIRGFLGGISLGSSGVITQPAGGCIAGGGISANGYVDPYTAGDVTIEAQYYDLKIDGEAVSPANRMNILDGTFSYDNETKTLTVLKDYEQGMPVPLVRSGIDGLRIVVKDEVTLKTKGVAFELRADTVITGGGTLTAAAAADRAILVENGAKLSVTGVKLDVEGAAYGIRAADTGSKLTITNADLKARGSTAAVAGFAASGGIVCAWDAKLITPEGGSVGSGVILDSAGKTAKEVYIHSVIKYGISIDNTAVTEENMDDVLGDGVFAYDPKTNTLTIRDDYTARSGTAVTNSSSDGLTIVIEKDLTLDHLAWNEAPPIALMEDTVITGPGSLTVNAPEYNTGILAYRDLTLKDIDLTVTGGQEAITGYGDMSPNKLIVDRAVIHAGVNNEWNSPIRSFKGGIEFRDTVIKVPAEGKVKDGMIVTAEEGIPAAVEIGITPARIEILSVDGDQMSYIASNTPKTGMVFVISAAYDEKGQLLGSFMWEGIPGGEDLIQSIETVPDAALYKLFLTDYLYVPIAGSDAYTP